MKNKLAPVKAEKISMLPESFALIKPHAHPIVSNEGKQWPFWPYSMMYKELFDTYQFGLAIISASGVIREANPMFSYLTGLNNKSLFELKNTAGNTVIDFDRLQRLLQDKNPPFFKTEINLGDLATEKLVMLQVGLICEKVGNAPFFIIECQNVQPHAGPLKHEATMQGEVGDRKMLGHEVAKRLLAVAKQHQEPFALVIINIDKFKQMSGQLKENANDDLLLNIVAERLKHLIRISDIVVKLGDGEFMILLYDVTMKSINVVAKKIAYSFFEEPIMLRKIAVTISLSMGISVYPESGQDYDVLFENADKALNEVIQNGGNNYGIFQPVTTKGS